MELELAHIISLLGTLSLAFVALFKWLKSNLDRELQSKNLEIESLRKSLTTLNNLLLSILPLVSTDEPNRKKLQELVDSYIVSQKD